MNRKKKFRTTRDFVVEYEYFVFEESSFIFLNCKNEKVVFFGLVE